MRRILMIVLFVWAMTTVFAHADSLTITWDANSEENLAGYMVYYGTSAGNYLTPINVGNITIYELSGLDINTTYYIALTAYDTLNNESEKSNEINASISPVDDVSPPVPDNFRQIVKAFMLLRMA